jgi:hypothetical protein
MFDALLHQLETDLRAALGICVTGLVATARTRLEGAHADVANERAKGLAEVAAERAKALAEVDVRRADFEREVAAMHTHREVQEGHVELNIGGYRFETSVRTLRRIPQTFFDAYFSGRYAQDVCNDGSIFVDRDGEHFGHILEYMRDGMVAVAEAGAYPSVSLLRVLKREFGFYCIELSMEGSAEPEQPELALVMGGSGDDESTLSSMGQYDAELNEWSTKAAMGTGRIDFGACTFDGKVYVIGGTDVDSNYLSSVEKYSPSSDTWIAVAPLPDTRAFCAAVSVGSAIFVLGGVIGSDNEVQEEKSVLKFDSVQGVWSRVAPMPEVTSPCVACVVGTDIYVFGGAGEEEYDDSVCKYSTEGNTWSVLAPMPDFILGHSVSVIDGLIYIIGAGNGVEGSRNFWRFEPVTGVWTTLASTLHYRFFAASFVLGGCLYAAGAQRERRGAVARTVERYDAATDTWSEVANMLEGRFAFGAVTIGPTDPVEEQNLFDSLISKAISEGV